MVDSKNNKSSFSFLIGKFASRKNGKNSNKFLISFILFVLVFFSNYYTSIKDFYSDKLNIYPILYLKQLANNIVEIPKLISGYIDIKAENKRLQIELDDLKIKNINSKEIETELKELKESIGLKYSISNFKSIEKVLGFDKGIFDSFLLISSTQKETIPDSIVISRDGLVGIIHNVNNNIARVITIIDPKFYIPVKSENGVHLILSGNGNGDLISKEIKGYFQDIESKLKDGDILYTSGEGGVFYSDIPVAKITNINTEKNEITAKPLVNLQSISHVWVTMPNLK